MPIAYLINGIPGAGKTTTARALAERLPRSAHVQGDLLQEMVVSGLVYPGGEPICEANAQIDLCIANMCRLALAFSSAGFTPVLDFVVPRRDRVEEYRRRLPRLDVRLVTLEPGIETALARDRDRPEKTVAHLWTHLHDEMRAQLFPHGLWIDNGRLSVAEVVDRILADA